MANLTLQSTLSWAQPFFPSLTLNIGSTGSQPFLTNANIVQQTILGPPLAWRWNRSSTTQSLVAGTQDYTASLSDFGFLEYASVTDGSSSTRQIPNIRYGLPKLSFQARPTTVCPQTDSQTGTISFRYAAVPDATYTATLVYQKTAPTMTGPKSSWAIPDDLAYVYQWGFLSMCLFAANDPRWSAAEKTFLGRLMSVSEIVNEQKNAFVETWMAARSQAQWFSGAGRIAEDEK